MACHARERGYNIEANLKKRRSTRLSNYNYTMAGGYFLTICSKDRKQIFGDIQGDKMHLNMIGNIVYDEWKKTFILRPELIPDEYVIMPNHFHALFFIKETDTTGMARHAPTGKFGNPVSGSLSTIVGSFKAAVTRQVNLLRDGSNETIWQRGFHEHVVRKEESLVKIREYIINNPLNWATDPENPGGKKTAP